MPAQIQAGELFSDTAPSNAVNAARLNNHVNGSFLLPGAIGEQADIGAGLADGDYVLVLQSSTGQLRKASNANYAVAVSKIYVSPSEPPTSFRDTAHAWIKTNPSTFQRAGLRLWDAGTSMWRRTYSVPLGTLVAYTDGTIDPGLFDGTGLGVNALAGWAHANGQNGTVDSRQLDDQLVVDGGTLRRTWKLPANTIIFIRAADAADGSLFDGTGLGKGNYLGFARCNGNNGTVNASGDESSILKCAQFIGYGSLTIIETRYMQFVGYTD